MTAGDNNSAYQNCASGAENLIRQPTAYQRQVPHRRNISRIDNARVLFVKTEAAVGKLRCHVECQQSAHAVITEPLPHLSEKECGQSARVTEESAIDRRGFGAASSSVNRCAHQQKSSIR